MIVADIVTGTVIIIVTNIATIIADIGTKTTVFASGSILIE